MKRILLFLCLITIAQQTWAQKNFGKDIKEALYIHDTSSTLESELVALKAFRDLTKKYPKEWRGFYWLAYLNTQVGRLDGMVESYPKDLDSKQLFREAMDLYRKSYDLKKEKTDAEESDFLVLEGFIYGWFSYKLAETPEQKAKYDQEKKAKYREALKLNPRNPLMYVMIATVMARSEDYNDLVSAIGLFDSADRTFNEVENRGLTTYWNKDFIGYWKSVAEKNLKKALDAKGDKDS
ncbi:MAG: hypothetical protein ABJF11_03480 [Reichenbachiella sp.]|uniref:tetratricopeptide repeat protein n=1 Tax=Reichenbachiella sp. TaxID=2184521 RepID=UPI003266E02A